MKDDKVNSFLAGVSGAAIGTAIAVAGTLVMKDNKIKAKIKNIFTHSKSELKNAKSALSN